MRQTATPTTTPDARYGEPGASTPWTTAESLVSAAPLHWLATTRPTGGPHITPLVGVWRDGAFLFVAGAEEQKSRNLAADPRCAVLTGRNDLHGGTDVVLEGAVEPVTEATELQSTAEAFADKFGDEWAYTVRGTGLVPPGLGDDATPGTLYRVAPTTAYAFGKEPYSQTRFGF